MTSLGHHFADPRMITEISTDTPGNIGKPWRNVVDFLIFGGFRWWACSKFVMLAVAIAGAVEMGMNVSTVKNSRAPWQTLNLRTERWEHVCSR